MYPSSATLEELNSTHPTFQNYQRVWTTIDDLITGGHRIEKKKREYIVKRPDEDPLLYELRLKKFVFTPVLGDAVKEYSTKITNAAFNVQGCESDTWEKFRKRTDGKKRTERELINKIFRGLIGYGRMWAFIDKTSTPFDPITKLQEESLGLKTRVVLFSPLQVINWGFTDDGEVDFIKVRQINEVTTALGGTRYKATWIIIDAKTIVKYSAFVALGSDGEIVSVESPAPMDNVTLNLPRDGGTQRDRVPMEGSPVLHGVGRTPVVYMPLDDELWSGNAAYLKALQHLQIENSWTDTATIAGYIQRLFKPTKKEPDNDPNFSFGDEDDDIEKIRTSNQHLLIGDDFKFAEASGSSLKVIAENVLDKIEQQIKAIVNLGNVSATKGAMEQSGVSKAIDFTSLNDTMKRYGSILTGYYTDILTLVAVHLGETPEEIEVSGLDTFDVDSFGNVLAQAELVSKIETRLPETARRLWWLKVAETMHSTVDAETKEQIRREAESMELHDPLAETGVKLGTDPGNNQPAKSASSSKVPGKAKSSNPRTPKK